MSTQRIRDIFTRDFIICSFAQFTFAFVYFSLVPTLPIYLSRLGSNKVEIGVLIGISEVSSLVIRLFVGRALVKTQEKKIMMAGTLIFVFTSIAYIFTPPFLPFLIVRVFQGVGWAFFQTASYTLIVNISPETHRGQCISYFHLGFNLSGALAPPLGMFFINHFSFSFLFWVCSGLSLGSFFMTQQLGRRPVSPSQDSSIEAGLFLSRKALPPSVISGVAFFTWASLASFFPLYAINHGVTNPGLFFTTMAIMLILGRSLGGKIFDLYSLDKIILPSLTTYIISMVILAFSKTLPMFIVVAAIWGMGHAFLVPALMAYAIARAGSFPGPAMGTYMAVSDLGRSLGPLIMGIILQTTSYPIMFLCLALTGLVNLNYFYFFVRKKG